jgi:hypothetical protein
MPAFALTIFTGAFLLFQVQPLIGKYILPWFGGGPGVWTTCMLFFQLLLLGGYAYAHALSRYFKPRTQAIVHGVLLVAALASLPITPSDAWKPTATSDPAWRILALLTASLGLPYLVLSATGPLLQEWFRRSAPGASPTNIRSALGFPTPKTTCVREATRFGHFTQPRIAFSSNSQVHSVAGGGGRGWTVAAGRVVAALRRRFNAVCEALGADLMPFWTSFKRGSASASAC